MRQFTIVYMEDMTDEEAQSLLEDMEELGGKRGLELYSSEQEEI